LPLFIVKVWCLIHLFLLICNNFVYFTSINLKQVSKFQLINLFFSCYNSVLFATLSGGKMKKILLFCVAVLCVVSTEAVACIGSNCKPCPEGYDLINKCCKSTDKNDCIFPGNEIEDCGVGQWSEYPNSLPFTTKKCCTDETENDCRILPYKDYCGRGEFREYPYSPTKMCCKDFEGRDCVTILAKRQCGKYQLKEYPLSVPDCCHSFLQRCTGKINDCPRCL